MLRSPLRSLLVLMSLLLFNNSIIPDTIKDNFQDPVVPVDPPFLQADTTWVDSIMQMMSLEDRIAQMMMVQAYSSSDAKVSREVEKLIMRHKVGGVIFFQGGPGRQAHMTNHFQEISEVPLLIAMDGEWGLGMRLDSVISYPRQMLLGAIADNDLIYQMGKDIAEQMKILGVHMNFAPVADVNINPENPVINTRSFGELRNNVSEKVISYFSGMQDNKLLVTAKHFPGHGDTDSDSHKTLPVYQHSIGRLDSIELFPFRESIVRGLTGIMVAHLHVPALDSTVNRATTLSKKVVSGLLKEEMGFKGLIVTDALKMKSVSSYFKPGELEVEAVLAGNDILLMPADVGKAISSIKRAVRKGVIDEERINEHCRKILMAKSWLDLKNRKPIETKDLAKKLNDRKFLALQHNLIESALTLVKNEDELIPLSNLESMKLATLNIGAEDDSSFTSTLDLYLKGRHFFLNDLDDSLCSELEQDLQDFNTLIINIHNTGDAGKNSEINGLTLYILNSLNFEGNMILNIFGYPYALGEIDSLTPYKAIMISYTGNELCQKYAAQGIFGGIPLRGSIPVAAGSHFTAGTGISTNGNIRLKYSFPEHAGMNYDTLRLIDSIVAEAIKEKAMPGCQLIVARKGDVVWNKSYGYHTYQNRIKVKNEDIYDLASVTKISATLPSLMKLQDQHKFNVDSTVRAYLPTIDTSNKGDLLLRNVLTHQSGLTAWIPFYQSTLEPLDTSQRLISNNFSQTYPLKLGNGSYANRNIVYKEGVYSRTYSESFSNQVAKDLFINKSYEDTIYNEILASPLHQKTYKYSDLGYYLLMWTVEYQTDTLLQPYTWHNFYGPLGAETTGFLPLEKFPEKRIVPTENDIIFRRQMLRGHVHDPGAAMLGGVSGHAGLFSNANDLAKLMQMYMNHGRYGGEVYIDSATLAQYTARQFPDTDNRRALGFDKAVVEEDDAGPACNSASASSYGHTGFTGTIVWMEPEYDLLYIFLSNRVHPNQANLNLITMDVRTNIQELLYRAIEE